MLFRKTGLNGYTEGSLTDVIDRDTISVNVEDWSFIWVSKAVSSIRQDKGSSRRS